MLLILSASQTILQLVIFLDRTTVLKLMQMSSSTHANQSRDILRQQAEREANPDRAETDTVGVSTSLRKRKLLTDEEELFEGDDDIVQWSAQVFEQTRIASQAEEPEVPLEGSSVEREFLTIINRKIDPINFSPVESIAKSHMTQKFLYEVIRVLKQKREPYWIGFKQENDFIQDIARFEVKFPGAEYVHGTQYWWIKPENWILQPKFPVCVIGSMYDIGLLGGKQKLINT